MRKLLIVTILLVMTASAADAQRIGGVKRRLAETSVDDYGRTASVSVRESGSAADAVRRGEAAAAPATINGYRIVIFFDNGATARADAERKMADFNVAYPDVGCDLRYENPYFKVIAGCCTTSDEAVMLLERVRRDFPQSYIMREEIALHRLITPKPLTDSSADAENEGENADGEGVVGAQFAI